MRLNKLTCATKGGLISESFLSSKNVRNYWLSCALSPERKYAQDIDLAPYFSKVENISEIKPPLTQNFHWTWKRGEKSNDSDTNTVTLNSLWKSFVREGFTLGCLVLGTAEFSWKIHVWKLNQKLLMTKKKSSSIEFHFFFLLAYFF